MPLDLPGFYWDEERNRYFPLAFKPKAPCPPPIRGQRSPMLLPATLNTVPRKNPRLKRHETVYPCATFRGSRDRQQSSHEILASHYATTSLLTHARIPTFGRIKSFCTTTINGESQRFLGDDQGWLYSCMTLNAQCEPPMQYWTAEQNLQHSAEISSICVSGSRRVATCFGPSSCAKISVQDLDTLGRTYLLSLNNVHDIWTSHLRGKSLVLGANEKAVYLSDIDSSEPVQFLPTRSDIFSVVQADHLIYTGARNGSIERFDMRLGKHRGEKLFDDRFRNVPRSSVLYLDTVRDSQLFVSHMNGELMTYDLRFSRKSAPVVRYQGHVNSYTRRLGIAIDHDQDFLFAAGQDSRIRGWSLNSGAPLCPLLANIDPYNMDNPFLATFKSPIETMQVSMDRDGTSLWAASDDDLYQYHLGQRREPI